MSISEPPSDVPSSSTSDERKVRPYGDTRGDGKVQMSFTLPVPCDPEGRAAAETFVEKTGFEDPQIYHAEDLGEGYTYFIIYASTDVAVDLDAIEVATVDAETMTREEVETYIRAEIGHPITVLGACTGTDAHSVGIDAIMNMKGYDGEYGLERYEGIEAINLGMQVPNEELVARAIETDADAILVSQIVTQNDVHLDNLSALIDILEAEGIRQDLLVLCGGPRIDHELALELGFDAGFGGDTTPPEVASYVVQTLVERDLA